MKRLVAWVAGSLGGVAAYRVLRRAPAPPPAVADTRAEELRARLAAARAAGPEPAVEATTDQGSPDEPDPGGPEARRRSVHEQARSAIDRMRQPEE